MLPPYNRDVETDNTPDETISVDDLRDAIEQQYQDLCRSAQVGGAATLDELANVGLNMSLMMQVVDDLAGAVIRLQDKLDGRGTPESAGGSK